MTRPVNVIGVGALKDVFAHLASAFATEADAHVVATWDTVGAQRDRLLGGAQTELVTLSTAAMDAVAAAGCIDPAQRRVLGSVEIAFAVPAGAPVPDVSTVPALRAALLSARRIAYADPARGATAGMHFAKVLKALDLEQTLADRLTVVPFGVEAVKAVSRGEFDIGVSQSSEIAIAPGVQLVMPLPAEFRLVTSYEIAPTPQAGPAALALLDVVTGATGQAVLATSGFQAR